jgi:cytochrome d ubiquinol oxidase subunit II
MAAATWLPMAWGFLIAFAVLAYVLLDGFDLGIGVLFLLERKDADRDVMVNSVAPVWDGNETWLVLGGGGLFAMFPLAYATIMSALYPTIIGMLLALVFRGVAFEFRFRARTRPARRAWDLAFFAGSTLAAFCQGLSLGGWLQGIHVAHRQYAGGWWDWLTGFSVLCGIALVIGYGLLGSCWLVWRTEGSLQRRARRHASLLAMGVLALIVVVSLWTPTLHEYYMRSWFGWPQVVGTSWVPFLVAVLAWAFWRAQRLRQDFTPFLYAQALFVLCYIGIGISVYPFIVPPEISIWAAAAPPSSQLFLLVGALILVPIILSYTGYAYWVFRGKVRADMHYH